MKKLKISRTRYRQNLDVTGSLISGPVREILFNLFSNAYQGQLAGLTQIKVKYILQDGGLVSSISEEESTDVFVILEMEGKDILLNVRSYWENSSQLYHSLSITSPVNFNFEGEDFFKFLIKLAIGYSELKGSYVNIEDDDFGNYQEHELPERSFNDVYLPAPLMRELRTYPAIFEKNARLLRYLLVGSPGTGKTEAVLAICNQLKKKGVTILKASVSSIKSHIEFAEVLAPALLVLDDLDLELGNRHDNTHTEHLKDFLDILDGVEKVSKDVGILATTNSIQLIDMAAQRPGRFHRIICLEGLTAKNMEGIIAKAMKSMEASHNPLLLSEDLIALYQEKNLNGSYIYNLTQMLQEQIDTGEIANDIHSVLEAVRFDLDNLEKIKGSNFLQ